MINFESVKNLWKLLVKKLKKSSFSKYRYSLSMTYQGRVRGTKRSYRNRDIKEVADALTDILPLIDIKAGINLDKL